MAPVTDERDGAPDRSPGEQLADLAADLFVYAPIGLFFEAPKLLPKLAEQGRGHARNARFLGRFAVRQGEAELRRRLIDLEAVRAYEAAQRGRKTVLNKIAQLQRQP